MKNLIGLITLFGITAGNVYSQAESVREKIVIDTLIDGGHFYFHFKMDNSSITYPDNAKKNENYSNINIISSAEVERKNKKIQQEFDARIDTMRVYYFTKVIGFTEAKAAVFWPVYNEYKSKLDKILEQRQDARYKLCDFLTNYKPKDYAAFIDIEIKSCKEEAMLREQYAGKFRTILGDDLYLLYRAEHLFLRWILTSDWL
jgi:hypothetical protein